VWHRLRSYEFIKCNNWKFNLEKNLSISVFQKNVASKEVKISKANKYVALGSGFGDLFVLNLNTGDIL